MPSNILITLDTSAPVIEWGAITGDQPGEVLRVEYTINEPEVVQAEYVDFAGGHHAMVDEGDAFTLVLPEDIPEGLGTVRALVRDDVLNEVWRSHPVRVGQDVVVIPETGPSPPSSLYDRPARRAPGKRRAAKTFISRSRTGSTIRIARQEERVFSSTSRSESGFAVRVRLKGSSESTTPVSTSQTRATVISSGLALSPAGVTAVLRRDAPDEEALLLDLI